MRLETITDYRARTAREVINRRAGEERRAARADAVAEWADLERRAADRRITDTRRENDRIAAWMDRFNAAKLAA